MKFITAQIQKFSLRMIATVGFSLGDRTFHTEIGGLKGAGLYEVAKRLLTAAALVGPPL
jgi:hypothetical protein